MLIRTYTRRFGSVPAEFANAVGNIQDPGQLEPWLDLFAEGSVADIRARVLVANPQRLPTD